MALGNAMKVTSAPGTILDGNYPAYTDSRMVSATIDLSVCLPPVVYLVPERKVPFLSFRPIGKNLNVNINNTIRFFATLEMTVLLSFRSGTI